MYFFAFISSSQYYRYYTIGTVNYADFRVTDHKRSRVTAKHTVLKAQGAKAVGKMDEGRASNWVSQITASMSGGVIDAAAPRNRRGVFQEIK